MNIRNDFFEHFHSKDEKAIHHIYSLHYKPLCYYAERILSGSSAEAEDVVVECFLKLIEKRDKFFTLQHIKSFLFTAVHNACIDVLRRRKKFAKIETTDLGYVETILGSESEELMQARVLQLIYANVERLPVQCKTIFKKSFISGTSATTIAEEMGLSKQTVLNQKARAIKLLRLILYDEGLQVFPHILKAILVILFFQK